MVGLTFETQRLTFKKNGLIIRCCYLLPVGVDVVDNLKDLEKECLEFMGSDNFIEKPKKRKVTETKDEKKYKEDLSRAKVTNYTKMHTQKIRNFDEVCFLPKVGEQYRLVTQQSFNMYTIILKILQQEDHIEELYLSSYNIKLVVMDTVFNMLESKQVDKLRILLSEATRARLPHRYSEIKKHMLLAKDDVKIKFNWNHTKIALVKTKKNYYVLEGSGNLTDNAQIEQYLFENNKQIFVFHKTWMDEAFIKNGYKREEIILPGCRIIK